MTCLLYTLEAKLRKYRKNASFVVVRCDIRPIYPPPKPITICKNEVNDVINATVPLASCPECQNAIRLRSSLLLNQLVKCGQCGEILSLVNLSPPTLTWASEHLAEMPQREIFHEDKK